MLAYAGAGIVLNQITLHQHFVPTLLLDVDNPKVRRERFNGKFNAS
jgi:hypothetical protein